MWISVLIKKSNQDKFNLLFNDLISNMVKKSMAQEIYEDITIKYDFFYC